MYVINKEVKLIKYIVMIMIVKYILKKNVFPPLYFIYVIVQHVVYE